MALMSSRVWPRAPRSGANETSDGININNSISGARGVDDNDNDNDNDRTTMTPSTMAEGRQSPSVDD